MAGSIDYESMISKVIESYTEKIIDDIIDFGGKRKDDFLYYSKIAFKEYYRTTINKYSNIKIILFSQYPVNIYQIYIDLLLKQNTGKSISTSNITNIIGISNYIIITGLAGCGKSTMMKHLFLNSIENTKLIPIFIELRNLPIDKPSLFESICILLENYNLKLEVSYIEKMFSSGKLIIFFDGFDEIDPCYASIFEKEIINISDKYNKNIYIISSRPSERFIGWERFTELHAMSLSKEQSLELIAKLDYDKDIKDLFYQNVSQTLYDRHKSFLSNPLLITIMLITFSQYADIPDKLHLFYSQAFDALFYKHDATKAGYKRVRKCNLPIDMYQKILSAVCFQSYIKNKYSFNKNELTELFNNSKKILHGIDYNSEDLFDDVIYSLCLIVQDGLIFTFTHRSFQEYFSALFVLGLNHSFRKKMLQLIKNRIGNDNTIQIIFDIDKNVIENDLLIEEINRIRDELSKEGLTIDEIPVAFYKKLFVSYQLNEKNSHVLYIGNIELFQIYNFCIINYRNSFPKIKIDLSAVPLLNQELIKNGFNFTSERIVPMESILSDEQCQIIYKDLLNSEIVKIKAFLNLPKFINQENLSMTSAIDELFLLENCSANDG